MTDMMIRTFFTQRGVVNRVIYELPHHEKVHKDTKMRLVENKGSWYVIADVLPRAQSTRDQTH
jgi:hypothetical protein